MIQKEIRDLVLIHGWGFGSRVWKNFIPYLEAQWRVTCIDLPGYGSPAIKDESIFNKARRIEQADINKTNIDKAANSITLNVPKNAIILAWSLGGMVAMKLVCRRDDLKALVLLASSPCFLNKKDWQHGIAPSNFNKLFNQLGKDKIKTLQMFTVLAAMGEAHPKQTINKLNECLVSNVPEQKTLLSGLEILRDEDLRQTLIKLGCPVGIIFGENDILVKRESASAIQELRPDIDTVEISGVGHTPFLSRPRETAAALLKLTAGFL